MIRKFTIAAPAILAFCAIATAADHDLKSHVLRAHGLDQFNQVEEIRFTFAGRTARDWEWRTNENIVTCREAKDGKVIMMTYDRDELDGAPESVIAADKKFINDSFWLMWPLHASWSEEAKLERLDDDTIKLAYPATGGGYSPGDFYVIDIDEGGLATKWEFHKGGAEQAGLINSFEDYVTVGPFKFAAMHQNDGGFKLEFKNIQVKLHGDPEWKTQ